MIYLCDKTLRNNLLQIIHISILHANVIVTLSFEPIPLQVEMLLHVKYLIISFTFLDHYEKFLDHQFQKILGKNEVPAKEIPICYWS